MEESAKNPLTAVDRIADGDGLQMIKAAIPYLPGAMQKSFSIYVKAMEVNNLLSYYNNPVHACSAQAAEPDEILEDIRAYCTDAQRHSLDQAVNLITALKLYQEIQKTS